jgi:hypothetical protein
VNFLCVFIKMSIDSSKRVFLKKISSGIDVIYQQEPFTLDTRDIVESFISKQLLTIGDTHTVFSSGKFKYCVDHIDSDITVKILLYFDSINVTISRVFMEAKINPLLLNKTELYYKQLIDQGDIDTFLHFLML